MSIPLRRILAATCATLLLSTGLATTSWAQVRPQSETASSNAPAAVDAMLLRPLGFVSLVIGTGLFVATLPIVAITRPHEIGKPFKALVAGPAKYIWADPLGGH